MAKIVLVAIATILGASARYVVDPVLALALLSGFAGVTLLLLGLAECWLRTRPVTAVWFNEAAWGWVFAVVALSAFAATWLGLWVPGLVADIPKEEADSLSGVILGALSALVGAWWLDDAKDKDGTLWPEARYRTKLSKLFKTEAKLFNRPATGSAPAKRRSAEMEKLYSAVYLEPDHQNRINGWSFADRIARARVVGALEAKP